MQNHNSKMIWILLLVLFLLVCSVYFDHNKVSNIDQQSQQNLSPDTSASSPKAAKGKLAPEITLNDLNGQAVKLSNYRGKVVVLNFWASWCPPCKSEMSELDKAAREYASGADAVLLTVNLTDGSSETVDKARKYIDDNKYSLSVLLDTQSRAANAYNITSIPTTYIIDKQGVIVNYIVGPTNRDALNAYVNQLK
jgi:cytochrome c biogenesis protein CcmG, thiol:disulfide interchange protein DsbE